MIEFFKKLFGLDRKKCSCCGRRDRTYNLKVIEESEDGNYKRVMILREKEEMLERLESWGWTIEKVEGDEVHISRDGV